MHKLVFIVLFVFSTLSDAARRQCAPRDYHLGATVCVCNATYCDDLSPLQRTAKGVITLVETGYNGDRFRETELKFGDRDSTPTSWSQMITINRNKTYQKIIGFGGAMTDAAGISIGALPDPMIANLISDYFSPLGLEYNTIRVPIGGSDFSPRPYTYDDVVGDESLAYFNLTDEDLLYKIPYILMGQKVSPHRVKVFGSPWAAPAWMKTNGRIDRGGFLIGTPGGKYYQIWANYFVKFLDAYKANGINVWGLTVENEPKAGNSTNYDFNCLGFTPETERDFVKLHLGPTLAKAGYGRKDGLELMVFDDQRPQIVNWATRVLGDAEVAQYASGVAFHWYENAPENLWELDKTHDLFPNHFILNTEACCEIQEQRFQRHVSNNSRLGYNWVLFEEYAYDIITDLNHWTTGWVDWNMALDTDGGPRWNDPYIVPNPSRVDTELFTRAPVIVNASAREYYKQPTFYAMGHFSKFLVPDSRRVLLVANITVDNFETTSFVRPDNSTVVVALNLNEFAVKLVINDPNEGVVERVVKPNSLQSYIWWN